MCRVLGMTGWPEGLYGLPMAINGCPSDSSIKWNTGTLYQDLEDTDPQTRHSLQFHLNAAVRPNGDVERSFCMKTSTINDSQRSKWPSGKYCIYLWGQRCPWGMDIGWVQWDDENTAISYNKNSKWGTVPKGVYDQNTRIYYCCSTRGSALSPISLPLDWPFYLIAYGSKTCQAVRGAMSNLEYIYYETEYLTILSKNDYAGAHPYGVTRDPVGHVIYYCYYRPIYCPPLRKPDNGELKPDRCGESNRNKFNDTCSVTCNPGFTPENPAGQTTTCLESGTWKFPFVTSCKRASSINVTASPVTSVSHHSTARTVSTQPTTFIPITRPVFPSSFITYPTAVSSGIVSAQSPSRGWNQSETRLWTATVYSSAIQVSKVTASLSVVLSASTKSPTLSSVGSSIPPRGNEARSSRKLFHGTNFLIGTAVGGLVLLGVIISMFVLYRRRVKYIKPRKGSNVKVYMSDIEKSLSMEDLVSGRQVMEKTSSQENLLYDSVCTQPQSYEDRSSENILYESCNPRFSVTKIEENVLYESVSFGEGPEDERDSGIANHLHYKTIT
ncbi:hypothetical protein ACROYT_G038479 [Oculina patagonica]